MQFHGQFIIMFPSFAQVNPIVRALFCSWTVLERSWAPASAWRPKGSQGWVAGHLFTIFVRRWDVSRFEPVWKWKIYHMGVSENRLNPYTQWFCWSLSLLNGYNWEYTLFSDKPTCSVIFWSFLVIFLGGEWGSKAMDGSGFHWFPTSTGPSWCGAARCGSWVSPSCAPCVNRSAWASGSLTKLRKMGSEDGLVCFFTCKSCKKNIRWIFHGSEPAPGTSWVCPWSVFLPRCSLLGCEPSMWTGPRCVFFGPKKHPNAAPRFHRDFNGDFMGMGSHRGFDGISCVIFEGFMGI